ncbi:hypothetical protein BU16DRAFT_616431 [Lophium mytilinum]|uniref:Uncharacterized protein n=1 Tax=Lophium mytilinum TaxID=390894 RepID=A0A6A6R025_9PEZI|nr:hypothetical protein BU16DRAFT_616431 [Lophium mytilinum]
MCRPPGQSDSPFQTILGLVWAMPVDIARFGAHLEAYVASSPGIQALRLCCRFGEGVNVYINKLPEELIASVIVELQRPARAIAFAEWSTGFKCFRKDCSMQNHMNGDFLREVQAEYRLEHISPGQLQEPTQTELLEFMAKKRSSSELNFCCLRRILRNARIKNQHGFRKSVNAKVWHRLRKGFFLKFDRARKILLVCFFRMQLPS